MTNPMIKIHNAETGEIVEREMDANELARLEADKAETLAIREGQAAKAHERAALLERLGITAEEAQLLLGGN
jgi:hypothetical protein